MEAVIAYLETLPQFVQHVIVILALSVPPAFFLWLLRRVSYE